jgi:hypothetical protein
MISECPKTSSGGPHTPNFGLGASPVTEAPFWTKVKDTFLDCVGD